jgi:tRNA (guanine37-N1)-methyltransferase
MSLRVDVLTLFPEAITQYCATSVLGRAAENEVWRLHCHNIRDAASGVHRSVDDSPFGGGAGMVMMAQPIIDTVASIPDLARPLIAVTPSGRTFNQSVARELAGLSGFSLLCGRYEGFDQRTLDHVVDDEISLGDFVLAGGELAALSVIEAVVRLLPGALGNDASVEEESFTDGLLEYPHYTKPFDLEGWVVPEILRSGDHARIARWRLAQAVYRTQKRRPDLISARGGLTPAEVAAVAEFAEVE